MSTSDSGGVGSGSGVLVFLLKRDIPFGLVWMVGSKTASASTPVGLAETELIWDGVLSLSSLCVIIPLVLSNDLRINSIHYDTPFLNFSFLWNFYFQFQTI